MTELTKFGTTAAYFKPGVLGRFEAMWYDGETFQDKDGFETRREANAFLRSLGVEIVTSSNYATYQTRIRIAAHIARIRARQSEAK